MSLGDLCEYCFDILPLYNPATWHRYMADPLHQPNLLNKPLFKQLHSSQPPKQWKQQAGN